MARMQVRSGQTEPPQSLVAATSPLRHAIPNKDDRTRRSVHARAKQADAWRFYDTVGELRYAVNWFSSALSRADLFISRRKPDNSTERVTKGPGVEALAELTRQGTTRLLKKMGQHYFVAGEWYLIGREVAGRDSWEVYAAAEVKRERDRWVLDTGSGVRSEELPDDAAVIKLWIPHPAKHSEPDSPVFAVLDDLEEIRLLTGHIRAQILSRLAGAGILVLPLEMSFAPPPGSTSGHHTVNSVDEFMKVLGRAMAEPIKNPDAPEAIVPIVIQAPGETIEKITHLKFWSDLDAEAADMRTKAIARFALGVDLPPEVLTGTAEANHWGAWAIEESTIKAHIEPALDLICEQLTTEFLWAVTEDETLFIDYDTTELKLRPNRSKEALELYDRGELSGKSTRRETGFTEDDKPTDEERQEWLVKKVAGGSATPEMVAEALRLMGVEGIEATGDYMREARPDPSLRDHPDLGIPDFEIPDQTAGACEVVVLRAMERAGNKMKPSLPAAPQVAAVDMYRHVKPPHDQIPYLLKDGFSMLDRVVPAQHLERYERGLTAYAHHLLRTQEPVDRKEMLEWMSKTP